jgi:hypothetical protein
VTGPLPSFDVMDWAEAFHKRFPAIAVDDLLPWFAGALMRGYDERSARSGGYEEESGQGALYSVAEDRCKVCKNDHYPACDAGPCINCDWPALECVHNGRCCKNCHHSQSDRSADGG